MYDSIKAQYGEFLLLAIKFLKHLTLILVGVDVAIRYNQNGISELSVLLAIIVTGFGLFGSFEFYQIRLEKKLKKDFNWPNLNRNLNKCKIDEKEGKK